MKTSTKRRAVVAVASLAALPILAGCSTSTMPDQTALAYNDGPFSPRTFDKCIPPSVREIQGPSDVAFHYPVNQRDWDFEGVDGQSDRAPLRVVVKGAEGQGNVEIQQPGILRYLVETDCGTLREFHELIGNRYNAYFTEDGQAGPGWAQVVLPKYLNTPLERTLQQVAAEKGYTYDALYNDPALRVEWQDEVERRLADQGGVPGAVNAETEGERAFFRNFQLNLGQPHLPGNLQQTLLKEQEAVAEADRQRAESIAKSEAAAASAESEKLRLQAEVAVAEAAARKRAAEIAPYGSPEEYRRFLCTTRQTNPCNPDQPTIVVPGTVQPQS